MPKMPKKLTKAEIKKAAKKALHDRQQAKLRASGHHFMAGNELDRTYEPPKNVPWRDKQGNLIDRKGK